MRKVGEVGGRESLISWSCLSCIRAYVILRWWRGSEDRMGHGLSVADSHSPYAYRDVVYFLE